MLQLADAKDVIEAIQSVEGARFPALTPNLKGFEAAVAAGVQDLAIFAAASESLSKSNINCNIEDSLARYRDVTLAVRKLSIPVRGWESALWIHLYQILEVAHMLKSLPGMLPLRMLFIC
ncbi:hydroxymethylglutaryl-CoA lyase, mitochondrial-like [Actinidia eriantha]|uniref:hydroxymethylglutaryl-CoA lyase, mitochondrial-like n=1 Tax=Actinidia eriantha TaxID=165200 RepID=UPI00258C037B|nr:hydroxymethylglutaryl-CoA lyase, mitochondrial-like [Actinidia eriantha]